MAANRSSAHLRTLSRLGVDLEGDVQRLAISGSLSGTTEVQDVTGLSGRLRLQRHQEINSKVFAPSNWMDKQREHLQAYEYLCHIGEAKEWIEGCIGHTIAPVVELEEQLRNGVVLARLAQRFMPELVPRIFEDPKLQFRHSDNINRFFKFVDRVNLAHNFRFELTDLYEKKNIPKVIYCIHALSFVLVSAGLANKIGNLVGKLNFTEEELRQTQKSLDATGVIMPNFTNVGCAVSGETDDEGHVTFARSEQDEAVWAVALQAQSKGSLLRQRICLELQKLEALEVDVKELQAHARAFLIRQQYYDNATTYKQIDDWTTKLQTVSRGYLARNNTSKRYCMDSSTVSVLQRFARGYLLRSKYNTVLIVRRREAASNGNINSQRLARGFLVRQRLLQQKIELGQHQLSLAELQAASRGQIARHRMQLRNACLTRCKLSIISLQAFARGFNARSHKTCTKVALLRSQISLNRVKASCLGYLMRRKVTTFHNVMEMERDAVVGTQAISRGLLTRLNYTALRIDLGKEEFVFTEVQRHARGFLKRLLYHAILAHYKNNMARVVKVQSFIRARQQGAAYKSLMTAKNPPISTIKNFIHLLSDSNFDFEEEVTMEHVRRQIVQSVRQNEAAEDHIEQMDIKIALLVKQAIKLDEVIQHQQRMDQATHMHSENPFDLRALNRSARTQLENYQKLFYLLQTQPVYLARLFSRMEDIGAPEKELKSIEQFVMVLYGYAQKKRESYFLLLLIRSSIIKEISLISSVTDFVRGQYVWAKILSICTKSEKDKKFIRAVLLPVVTTVLEDEFLDLESDPLVLYNAIIHDEEFRTGQASMRPRDVTYEFAIQNPDTRVMFIKHLRDLRNLTEQILEAFETHIVAMPFDIRYVARETIRAMREHIPNEPGQNLERLIGNIVLQRYLLPALISPERHGLAEANVSQIERRNLAEVARMLNQIATGKLFEEGSYLQPLNEFVSQAIHRVSRMYESIIHVPDAEEVYKISELDDLAATKRPILYIKASDIFFIHSVLHKEVNILAPERDDILHELLMQMGSPPSRPEDMMLMSISNSEMALTLDPKALDVEDPEAEERALFMQTKRYLLYIIRVQSGSSLVEILVQPVDQHDEIYWQSIAHEELSKQKLSSSTMPYEQGNQDMFHMSYLDLKRECLENIVSLERLGWITRDNQYQELLNSIADDIRTQNKRRMERQYELQSSQSTLHSLREKRRYLDGQLQSYNDYIEQAMLSLQSKKTKKKSALPFTKQYFHMRDLQKTGKVPKFGSRKYSGSKLYDKGVLIAVIGEQAPFERISLTISSDQIGQFSITVNYQGNSKSASTEIVMLDDLLQAQYNKAEVCEIVHGTLTVKVSAMLNLVFKHFFSQ